MFLPVLHRRLTDTRASIPDSLEMVAIGLGLRRRSGIALSQLSGHIAERSNDEMYRQRKPGFFGNLSES